MMLCLLIALLSAIILPKESIGKQLSSRLIIKLPKFSLNQDTIFNTLRLIEKQDMLMC